MQDTDWRIRLDAAETLVLGRIDQRGNAGLLVDVRRTLWGLRDAEPQAIEVFVEALQHTEELVRRRAAQALREIGGMRTVKALKEGSKAGRVMEVTFKVGRVVDRIFIMPAVFLVVIPFFIIFMFPAEYICTFIIRINRFLKFRSNFLHFNSEN